MEIGTGLGIYWDDIVFFDNGKLPKQPTEMYTEGKIHKITKNAIIISNPITIKIKKKLENHPQQKATYAAIPFNLIKSVDKYE